MSMKKILATTALTALLATGASAAASAKDGFYVAPGFGWLVPNHSDISVVGGKGSIDFDNGWMFTGAVGYRMGSFRFEGELGYGETDGGHVKGNGTKVKFGADQSVFTGTVAGYYDVAIAGFTPYVGAGIGFADVDIDNFTVAGTPVDGGSNTDLSMFGEVGVAIPMTKELDLVPSYRYVWINNGGSGVDDSTASLFRVAVRYNF